MQAIVLSIGDELVLGQTTDTNSAYLSAKLSESGIFTLYHQVVADDCAAIVTAIRQACAAAELVLISGGLGPTQDDLTRQALADAMGVPLVTDAAALEAVKAFFQSRGRTMAPSNAVQAMCPAGAKMIPNSCGTAPGISATLGSAHVHVMPGVPREMKAMFETSIAPLITHGESNRNVILTTKINTLGLGESTVGERLGPLMARDRNPKVGTTVAGGIVSVRVRSEFSGSRKAHDELASTCAAVEAKLGAFVFSRDDQPIQTELVLLLKSLGVKVATAESCTGGMLGQMLTDVPGSSEAYLGGWITYSNAMKSRELGVDTELISGHGAVSAPVALAMAQGALRTSGADLAVSITGIAGPDGGTAEKPVGTVFMGLAWNARLAGGAGSEVLLMKLWGERSAVRDRTCKSALQIIRWKLLGLPTDAMQWTTRVEPSEGREL